MAIVQITASVNKTKKSLKGYNCAMKYFHVFMAGMVGIEAYNIWQMMVFYSSSRLMLMATSEVERPFAFRVLVPFISRILDYAFPEGVLFWMGIVFALSAVFFYFSSKYLYDYFKKDAIFLPFVSCQALLLITFMWIKPYDYASAAFFALCLGLLVRRKHGAYLFTFFLASLNKETTFLLILFFMLYFINKMKISRYAVLATCQIIIYLFVKFSIQYIYRDNGGQVAQFNALLVISTYFRYFPFFLISLSVFYIVLRNNKSFSEFVRVATISIFVPQIVLHLLFGMPFEFRVFAESIPLLSIAITMLLGTRS